MKKGIAIITTGGTILSKINPSTGIVKPSSTGQDFVSKVPGLGDLFDVKVVEFCNMPGSDLTLEEGLNLSQKIKKLQQEKEIDGIVVMQGTDTMDEIPYFVGLTTGTDKPIVFTGAMKSQQDAYSDGIGNVIGAAQVAACEDGKNKGVLVYFNETIFSAEDLIKSHASRIDAFTSSFGPVGNVTNGVVQFYRDNKPQEVYTIDNVDYFVPILKAYTGVDNRLLELALQSGAQGFVLEGYGSGNVPKTMVPVIEKIMERNIPVILTTRCAFGKSYACYGYVGGGAQLGEEGVILSGSSSSIKSRIKLIVMLAAGRTIDQIRESFDNR